MIEKMRYFNMIGKVDDVNEVIEKYICKFNIQLEYSPKELADTKGVFSFNAVNPYATLLKHAEKIASNMDIQFNDSDQMQKDEAIEIIEKAYENSLSLDAEGIALSERIAEHENFIKQIEPFTETECSIEDLTDIKFIKYRFGRMPLGSYKQFQTFLYANKSMLFIESGKRDGFMYGVCFVTHDFTHEADPMLMSYHFERTHVPYVLDGKPLEGSMFKVFMDAKQTLESLKARQTKLSSERLNLVGISLQQFTEAYHKVRDLHFFFETRKYAARTRKDFFIFVGWISETDLKLLEKAIEGDDSVIVTYDDGSLTKASRPPTKLKNPFFAKPFEMLVNMYGLPTYNEVDPTIFIALTYSVLFGIMFGDLGQGAVLSLAGYLLYKLKGLKLGAIVSIIGLFSMFFGLMYGSIFGMEEIIEGIWIKPVENINMILVISVVLGGLLIVCAMLINMYNAVRQKKWGELLFSPNGIAGIVFYLSVICAVVVTVLNLGVNITFFVALAVIALAVIAFREPLSRRLEGKKVLIHGNIALYLFEIVIELFEVVLSYFTNTVSFVRVGAFALSHAGIMGVVLMLSETGHESYNIFGLIIGNLIVICFEGLVVGIQALRLDFYEMFSRFYEGDGKPFVPYNPPKA